MQGAVTEKDSLVMNEPIEQKFESLEWHDATLLGVGIVRATRANGGEGR